MFKLSNLNIVSFMISEYLSVKIKALSFTSIILVVFIHSYNLTVNFRGSAYRSNSSWLFFIQDIVSQGLARIGVPFFFIFSGYLFYYKFNGSLEEFLIKIKKRTKTILFPYFFWSILSLTLFYLLQLIPQVRLFFAKELVKNYSMEKLITTVFWDPLAYQLWFLRDLIFLVLLSPFIYFAMKYMRYLFFLFLLIAWFLDFNFIVFSSDGILFFVIGAFFALNQTPFEKTNSRYGFYFICLWVALVLMKTILTFYMNNAEVLLVIYKLGILTGIYAIWIFYDFIFKKKNLKSYSAFGLTFFVYVFHEPMLTIIKKTLFFILPSNELSSVTIYFLTPLITIFSCLFIGFYIKLIWPKFYFLVTGNR